MEKMYEFSKNIDFGNIFKTLINFSLMFKIKKKKKLMGYCWSKLNSYHKCLKVVTPFDWGSFTSIQSWP